MVKAQKKKIGRKIKRLEFGIKLDNKKLLQVLLFLIKFNLLAIPMYLAIYFNLELIPLQQFLADAVYAVLRFLGYDVMKGGLVLTLTSGFTIANIKMSVDCVGWKSMYALAALAIATPLPNDLKKLKFIVAGVLAVAALNFARVLTTILAFYHFGLQALDVVHTFLWREGLIITIVLIWLMWLKSARSRR